MTKEDLIDKYSREWNKLSRQYAEAQRLKYATDNPQLKADYQADQDSYAAQKMQVGRFLEDLQKLKCR